MNETMLMYNKGLICDEERIDHLEFNFAIFLLLLIFNFEKIKSTIIYLSEDGSKIYTP